ncbi:6677_t:CDS:2, partial [Entrophospora sp. SA101]
EINEVIQNSEEQIPSKESNDSDNDSEESILGLNQFFNLNQSKLVGIK